MDHAADPPGAVDRGYRDLSPSAATALAGLGDRPRHRAHAYRPSAADGRDPARGAPARFSDQPGARPAGRRFPDPARLYRRCRPRAADTAEYFENAPRYFG